MASGGTARAWEDFSAMTSSTSLYDDEPDDEADWDVDPNPEMVHWQPTHKPDAVQVSGARLAPAGALGVIALGSVLAGAFAVGALAIGALAIGALSIGRARVRRLEIDELVVGEIRFKGEGPSPD